MTICWTIAFYSVAHSYLPFSLHCALTLKPSYHVLFGTYPVSYPPCIILLAFPIVFLALLISVAHPFLFAS